MLKNRSYCNNNNVHITNLSSMATLCNSEMIAKAFQIKDLPVMIPISRLKVRVVKMLQM